MLHGFVGELWLLSFVDIRLNPILEKKCLSDAEKFCSAELKNRVTDKEDDGHVLLCLRKAFAKKVF